MAVRPAMVYGAEPWAAKKAQEKKLDVAEINKYIKNEHLNFYQHN